MNPTTFSEATHLHSFSPQGTGTGHHGLPQGRNPTPQPGSTLSPSAIALPQQPAPHQHGKKFIAILVITIFLQATEEKRLKT